MNGALTCLLIAKYQNIIGWQEVPAWPHSALFICGSLSPCDAQESDREDIARQFPPQARAHVVVGTGHWVRAEKPEIVLRVLHRFLGEA